MDGINLIGNFKLKNMHILDFIIYVLSIPLLWMLIGKMSNNELTEELGSLAGCGIIAIYTIIYIILFVVLGLNWVDLLHSQININLKW